MIVRLVALYWEIFPVSASRPGEEPDQIDDGEGVSAESSSGPPLAIRWQMMARKTLTLVGVVLAVFHVWLFAGQVWHGQLADLALVSRWVIAGGLVAGLLNLQRRGLSMIRGRHAVAIWLLAALLHGPALARDLDVVTPAIPEVMATVVQVVTTLAVVGLTFGLIAGLRRRQPHAPGLRFVELIVAPTGIGALPRGSFLRFASRPPPHA